VTVTLNLKPEVEAGLLAHAQATGLTIEDYLQQLVEKELAADAIETGPQEESGMVWENGLFVYRTGRPLPAHVVDDAIRRSREERAQHILGNNS
jgi:methionine salvage enolase-phosphatase E1